MFFAVGHPGDVGSFAITFVTTPTTVFNEVTFGWLKMLVASVKNCALIRSFSVKSVRV